METRPRGHPWYLREHDAKIRFPVGGQAKRAQNGTFSTLFAFVPWLNDLGSKF